MRIFVSAVALTLLLVVAGAVATSQDADLDAERLAGEAAANAAREAAEADPEVQEMRRMMDQILGDEGEAAAAAAASDDGTIEEQAKRKLNPEEYEMYKVPFGRFFFERPPFQVLPTNPRPIVLLSN